jgi:Universal stress protein family
MSSLRRLNPNLEGIAMLPIKTILVATDFSPMSEHAVRFAGALARDYGLGWSRCM